MSRKQRMPLSEFLRQIGTDESFGAVLHHSLVNLSRRSIIYSDGYHSYFPALEEYTHEHKNYVQSNGMLHWLYIVVSNAKTFILGTYQWSPKDNLLACLDEFSFHFSSRIFGVRLTQRLILVVAQSCIAY